MYKENSAFIVLYITDVEKTHNFYKSIGAEIKEFEADKVVVKLGGYDLHFIKDVTEPWEEYAYAADKSIRGASLLFYIEVENLDEAFGQVKSADGKIKSDIKENWWGGSEFLFEDPNGYKFVFYKMN